MKEISEFMSLGSKVIPGNELQIKLGLIALSLNRHVLIEDVPGMGKTTLVKFFSKAFGLDFRRIQFTVDLLPSDILGISIFHKERETFVFRPGPIFGELILADELNRGTPKTQSALLQAMEEKHITIDGSNYPLAEQFSIFATQNPRGQYGTHPLPESQLDRFLFKFSMGKLSEGQEIELLQTGHRDHLLNDMQSGFGKDQLHEMRQKIHAVKASATFFDYLARVLSGSRLSEDHAGLSPRAGLDLLAAAKAWAFLEGRDYLIPDDVQSVFPYVAGHRMFSYMQDSTEVDHRKSVQFISTIPLLRV
jgi:MoxR-like ATPase